MINDKNWQIGDVVYWMHKDGFKPSIHYGIVNEVFHDCLIVDYLEPYERRLVNGIPIDDFVSEEKYHKLPKGWTYNTPLFSLTWEEIPEQCNRVINIQDPKSIKQLYELKLLVPRSTIFQGEITADVTRDGYRIIKRHQPWYMADNKPPQAYVQYHEAKRTYQEVKELCYAESIEYNRQASLSDEEWSMEQINKTLDRWQYLYGKTDEEVANIRTKLFSKDDLKDLEVRIADHQIQWKYDHHKKWYPTEG